MKKTKAFICAILALASTLAVTGCGKEENSSSENPFANFDFSEEGRKQIKEYAQASDLFTVKELENKKIKWLSDWDIKPTEKVVFEEMYGGEVEWIQCTFANRYEKLAELINSGDGVDMFYAGNMDAFPKGAVRGMFAPVDDYIDFSSPLWEDVQEVNDSLIWDGNHYCTVVQTTGDKVACVYNKKTIAEAGLEDPADLYERGEWDWNAFESMLQSFVDVENQHYGIDGWWYEFALMATTGVPPVTIEDGKLVSNIGDPAMERVQDYMFDLNQTGCIAIGVGDYGWTAHPEFVGEGKVLFYPVGLYTFYTDAEDWKGQFGEDAFFVPMPKDPSADEYYVPVGMEAYTLIKGASNPEGVARYLDCKRFTILDEGTKALADKQFKEDYGWTDEMVEMQKSMQELADENPFLDISTGISTDCGTLLDSNLRLSAKGTPWNETYEAIYATLDTYLEEINANPVASVVE